MQHSTPKTLIHNHNVCHAPGEICIALTHTRNTYVTVPHTHCETLELHTTIIYVYIRRYNQPQLVLAAYLIH